MPRRSNDPVDFPACSVRRRYSNGSRVTGNRDVIPKGVDDKPSATGQCEHENSGTDAGSLILAGIHIVTGSCVTGSCMTRWLKRFDLGLVALAALTVSALAILTMFTGLPGKKRL